ncbi:MAG TPA: hypothetical protein VFV09_04175 [Actinomycetota bacterium]|jgi:hypothetical protein|nr:hypothetical protein [Actinomycetota bacterium]
MADEESGKSKPMIETIMNVQGNKKLGPPPDRKKNNERILAAYADRPETRDPKYMEGMERSMNEEPKSLGERIDEDQF